MADQHPHHFEVGIFLDELDLPFDEALRTAKEIGAESVWFARPLATGEKPIAEMSDSEVSDMADRVAHHGLRLLVISAGMPFKLVDLDKIEFHTLESDTLFKREFDDLVRSMEIAAALHVNAVNVFSFGWPGEFTHDKPTWPMRWLTRGGVASAHDMEKLVKAYSLVLEQAEKHDVDVVVNMMPWNYTNTTGNFRRLAERLDSKRIKVMWGPGDNFNSGESDVATAGFLNVHPRLFATYVKDLHINDSLNRDLEKPPAMTMEYRPIGEGDVDYLTILRQLRDSRCEAPITLATHFRPPNGSAVDAMRINFKNLTSLIDRVQQEVPIV